MGADHWHRWEDKNQAIPVIRPDRSIVFELRLKKGLEMTVASATQNSWMPSIGRALGAIPKAMTVGLAAGLSGISNICSDASATGARHGGGLQTGAYAQWRTDGMPKIQACLSEPWVGQFTPRRAQVACLLQQVADWKEDSEDDAADEVISRSVAHHKFQSCDAAPDRAGPTPGAMREVIRDADIIVRGIETFDPTMERAESELWFYSTATMPELSSATEPYTVNRLIALLNESVGVDGFKEQTSPLSFKLHEMFKSAGDLINRLKPELMRSPADLAAFEKKLNKHFVATQGTGMNEKQFRSLLSFVAEYMNNKYSLRSS
jgi:hypothetical protein